MRLGTTPDQPEHTAAQLKSTSTPVRRGPLPRGDIGWTVTCKCEGVVFAFRLAGFKGLLLDQHGLVPLITPHGHRAVFDQQHLFITMLGGGGGGGGRGGCEV